MVKDTESSTPKLSKKIDKGMFASGGGYSHHHHHHAHHLIIVLTASGPKRKSTPKVRVKESQGHDEDREYNCERILDIYVDGNTGERLFLVRWEGYDPSYDTWEPVEMFCEGLDQMIADYHKVKEREAQAARLKRSGKSKADVASSMAKSTGASVVRLKRKDVVAICAQDAPFWLFEITKDCILASDDMDTEVSGFFYELVKDSDTPIFHRFANAQDRIVEVIHLDNILVDANEKVLRPHLQSVKGHPQQRRLTARSLQKIRASVELVNTEVGS